MHRPNVRILSRAYSSVLTYLSTPNVVCLCHATSTNDITCSYERRSCGEPVARVRTTN